MMKLCPGGLAAVPHRGPICLGLSCMFHSLIAVPSVIHSTLDPSNSVYVKIHDVSIQHHPRYTMLDIDNSFIEIVWNLGNRF